MKRNRPKPEDMEDQVEHSMQQARRAKRARYDFVDKDFTSEEKSQQPRKTFEPRSLRILRKKYWALQYLMRGFSIFPAVRGHKGPPKDWGWKEYQTRYINKEEWDRWWNEYPDLNIGIVTGRLSGLVVVDVDSSLASEEVKKYLPNGFKAPAVHTRPGRYQIYFQYPEDMEIRNDHDIFDDPVEKNCDVRGEGGIVIAPPSQDDTHDYYFFKGLELPHINEKGETGGVEVPEIPEALLEKILSHKKQRKSKEGESTTITIGEKIPDGARNNTIFEHIKNEVKKGRTREETKLSAMGIFHQCEPGGNPPFTEEDAMYMVDYYYDNYLDQDGEEKGDTIPFPTEVMDGLAGEFADLYSTYLESPKQFFYMAFLTCLGSHLSDWLTIDLELQQQPRFYTILLGESADDRKSTAIWKTVNFFKLTYDVKFCLAHGVGSAEGLQRLLKEHNRLILCFDEFKQFTNKCGIENSVLLPAINTLFEENEYGTATKDKIFRIEDAYLSMLAASTTATYDRIWNATRFLDIGFNNRLFLVPGRGKRRFPLPKKIPQDHVEDLSFRVRRLKADFIETPRIKIESEAEAIFNDWYLNLENSVHTKRLDTYATRLMSVMSVNEKKTTVDADIIEKILKIVNWQLEVRRLLDPVDAEGIQARMEQNIRRNLQRKPLTEGQLKNNVRGQQVGIFYYERAKTMLEKAGEIYFDKGVNRWKYRVIR